MEKMVRELLRRYPPDTPVYHRPAMSGLALSPVRRIVCVPVTRPGECGECYEARSGVKAGDVLMLD